MNLMDLARADTKAILDDTENGFSKTVSLDNRQGQTQTDVPCFNIRTVQELDPETGILVNSKKSALNIALDSVTIGTPKKDWVVTFTDYEGNDITGRVIRVDQERTLGYVSLIVGV